ncbi:cupin domain-containing protein [Roseivirga misakiensis]|uniref:Cupin 2 conserved barrel domain-containing protein n=1 Tax=Roseivirga misakiensis TaxID=1563681 RepID=A0A1E5SZ61_9BACT|nr:hypothetical protein [Roseivirga misakiensis]OEK04396.1 hypothetical protein BFP71_13015 [Roseivirga misakiensis]
MDKTITLTTISNDGKGKSYFDQRHFPTDEKGGMWLTDRINALNFRLRSSLPGYKTEFHVAGDPTLIIIQQGTLRITLNDGAQKDFVSGDMFIAEDFLDKAINFNNEIHGHKAEVIGKQSLKAVHIKLSEISA